MTTYLIAWTEYFGNTICIESYAAENPLEAARKCWLKHLLPKEGEEEEKNSDLISDILKEAADFSSIEDIQFGFFNGEMNISTPKEISEF